MKIFKSDWKLTLATFLTIVFFIAPILWTLFLNTLYASTDNRYVTVKNFDLCMKNMESKQESMTKSIDKQTETLEKIMQYLLRNKK